MGKKLIDNVKAIGSMIDFVGGQYYKVRTEMAKDDDNLVLISSNDRDVYGEAMLCENDEGVVILFKTNSSRTFVFMVEMVVYRVLPEVIRNGDYIFVNDVNKGIHIIDNTNPVIPKAFAYIKIPGNEDISVKDDFLYADSASDLLVFDISNINAINLAQESKLCLSEVLNFISEKAEILLANFKSNITLLCAQQFLT